MDKDSMNQQDDLFSQESASSSPRGHEDDSSLLLAGSVTPQSPAHDTISNQELQTFMAQNRPASSHSSDVPAGSVRSIISGKSLVEFVNGHHPLKQKILETSLQQQMQSEQGPTSGDSLPSYVKVKNEKKSYRKLVCPKQITQELKMERSASDSDAVSDSGDSHRNSTSNLLKSPLLASDAQSEDTAPAAVLPSLIALAKRCLKYLASIRFLMALWACVILVFLGLSIYLVLQQTYKNFSWDENGRLQVYALQELHDKLQRQSDASFMSSNHLHLSFLRANTSEMLFSSTEEVAAETFANNMAFHLDKSIAVVSKTGDSLPIAVFYCSRSSTDGTLENCVAVQRLGSSLKSYVTISATNALETNFTTHSLKRNGYSYSVDTAGESVPVTSLLPEKFNSITSSTFQLLLPSELPSGFSQSERISQLSLFPQTNGLFGVYTVYPKDILSVSSRNEIDIRNVFLAKVSSPSTEGAVTNPLSIEHLFANSSLSATGALSTSLILAEMNQNTDSSSSEKLINYFPEGADRKYSAIRFNLGAQHFLTTLETDMTYAEEGFLNSMLVTLVVSTAIAVGLSVICSLLATELILVPLESVRERIRSISEMKLDENHKTLVYFQEYEYITSQVNRMQRAMKSFSKFVPIEVVRNMIQEGKEAQAGVVETPITIFFCDIVGFTDLTESIEPALLADTLTVCFECLTSTIASTSGTIDKFIGDAILAFWNAPKDVKEHPVKGVRAAVQCQLNLKALRNQFLSMGVPPLKIRIGMDYGASLVGMVGSQERLNYTVLGPRVNSASRLEAVNKFYQTEILISHHLYAMVRHAFVCRPIDICTVQGQKTPIILYEVKGEAHNTDDQMKELCYHYKIGFHYYLRGEYELAVERFLKYRHCYPNDHATRMIVEKCQQFISQRPLLLSEIVTTTTK